MRILNPIIILIAAALQIGLFIAWTKPLYNLASTTGGLTKALIVILPAAPVSLSSILGAIALFRRQRRRGRAPIDAAASAATASLISVVLSVVALGLCVLLFRFGFVLAIPLFLAAAVLIGLTAAPWIVESYTGREQTPKAEEGDPRE